MPTGETQYAGIAHFRRIRDDERCARWATAGELFVSAAAAEGMTSCENELAGVEVVRA
jgi:hypothetical protein